MPDYGINIGINLKGDQRLNQVKSTLSQINQLASNLKPINLLAPGAGKLGNEIRKAMKPFRDFAREAQNANQTYSNTVAGATNQARTFETVLKNVKIAAGGYSKQVSEVKGFANALAQATAQAQRLERNLENLKRDAFQQAGLPVGPATQLGTLEADLARLNFQKQQQNERSRAARNALLNRRRRFTDIATGAGFPLLFGGGPVQALAGGAGGAVGGLGGAIAASAVASQIEAFAASAAQAGQALQSTGGALEFVREKSLFSSEQAEDLAAKLEQQGKVQELATLLTDELTEVIGTSGLIALQDLGATTDKTTKLWNQLTAQLQILISGPLNGFLSLVNEILGVVTEGLKPTAQQDFVAVRDKILRSGTAEQITQIQAIEAQVRGTVSKNIRGGAFKKGTQAEMGVLGEAQALKGLELAEQAGLMPEIAVTLKDLRTITPPRGKKTKKERESRLPQLRIEVGLTERLNTLNRQILQAKQDEDLVREAALQMEIALESQAAKIAKINLDKIPQAEKEEQIKKAGLQTDQKIFEINQKLQSSKQAQTEKNQEIIADLQNQNNLLQAQLDGRLEEEKIEQQLAKLKDKNKRLDVDKIRNILEARNALKEQIAIADQLDQVYATIGQSITSGIVDALTAAVEGTKSLADVAGQTLRQVANILLQFGVQTALGGIPGLDKFFPGRALGGSVSANKPYMVGERGPELFVPGAQGNIVPNNAISGANIVVNVDASGSQAQGNQPNAKALGSAIGAAVQAELIKQKRPGGLLG